MKRFEGLTVLISGATGGFGAVSARMFAEEGANLVLSDMPGTDLDGLAAEFGPRARALAGDVADPQLHRDLVELAATEFDGIDAAVNNAGISHGRQRIEDIPEDKARQVIEVDLMGVWHALRAQIPAMDTRRGGRGGAIVNIASLAGIAGAPQIGIYAAAKHGVVGLTKTAAAENARRGIRVNALCPAFARTPIVQRGAIAALMAEGKTEAEAEAYVSRGVPMRRLGSAEEVAQAIVWCAAPENGFMTGQAIAIDGGVTSV